MTSGPQPPASSSMPYPPGTVLAGKYRVERQLGEGGMGWVVEATHVQLEQRVAVKFMRASATENQSAVARFLREARAAARIQSEHVARVTDVGTLESGAPYLVMEFLEGRDLESLVREEGAMAPRVVADYALQACEGLAEAHAAGIVHRDLKPANLFLARKTDGSVRVKLLDFGISKLAPAAGSTNDVSMTSTQTLMGSPLYMSPEQLRSSKNVDLRTDIWSMGVILYEVLGGTSPFEAATLPEVCARIMTEPPPPLEGVPSDLAAVVMRCLEKEAADRFQDVGALAMALAPFASPEVRRTAEQIVRVADPKGRSIPPPGPVSRAGQVAGAQTNASFGKEQTEGGPRRSRSIAAGGAVALVGVAVALGYVATRPRTAGPVPIMAASGITSAPVVGIAATETPASASAAPSGSAATATATATATASATASAAGSASATAAATTSARPRARPPIAAPAATRAAGTSAFGGRD